MPLNKETKTNQILDEVLYISHYIITLRKNINPSVISPVISKLLDKMASLHFIKQPIYVKENSGFKPALLLLKIDLSHKQDMIQFF